MASGLPGFTTISSRLRAKITGWPMMSPACCTVAMSPGEAEAKTSAGAPCWICVARAPDDPKLKAMVVPGCFAWKDVSSWPKAPVSDEAADTVIEPVRAAVVVVVGELEELPQAVATRATAATAAAARLLALDGRIMRVTPPSSPMST